ncbi:PLP-dependent aminotransferase family protein [Bacillus sp. REN3]|uniref:MocR-like pyridoxine biosynthesis transcription factor PdxR n=1 Tax=Bacillus sp. REN3 TaxID=2802440 RepID=UPI001AEE2329
MFEILLATEEQNDAPLYLQIYKQFRTQIRNGNISDGSRLPSIRSLQSQLNISKTPIETAYQMLIAEGYVISKDRSGLYAVNTEESPPLVKQRNSRRDSPGSLLLGLQTAKKTWKIDFDPSAVDKEMFPIRIWKKTLNHILEDFFRSIGEYGDMQGEASLRAELATYLRNSRGVICSPGQIIIGSGISYSIGILSKLLTDVKLVGMEEPGFEPVREQFRLNDFEVVPIPIQDGPFPVEKLDESKAQMVYVTPSHQFPTGKVMPYAEREQLLNWAYSKQGYIVEDDYDGEFRYIGKPIPSLQSLDQHGRVIYIGTFSKAFSPAFRMNYMVLPMELAEKLETIRHLLACPSRVDQWAMSSFIEQGHWYRHIRRMRNVYRKKHRRLIELIQVHFNEKCIITGHSAGLHIQLTVRTKLSAAELLQLAKEREVKVYDFRQMWIKEKPAEYPNIYLGFGGISEEEMETGILLLKEAWSGILD